MPGDPPEPPQDPNAGLFYAAEHGRTDVLKMCIKLLMEEETKGNKGKQVDAQQTMKILSKTRKEDGATPLHVAVIAGQV